MAPVCSSWVFMNQGTAARTPFNPLGNVGLAYVREANCMVARCILLCVLLTCRGVHWLLEQPRGSCMQRHPYFQWMMSQIRIYRHSIAMSSFGAPSSKPTWLYSASACVADVDRYESTTMAERIQLVKTYKDAAGKLRCVGAPSLKASQAYPLQFGHAVLLAYLRNEAQIKAAAVERLSYWETA